MASQNYQNSSFEILKFHEALHSEGKYSDVILVVKGQEFPVHRVLLAPQSDFFDKLFYGNQFMEADQKKITIDAPLNAFKFILKFMYLRNLDELPEKSDYEAIEILELSHRYVLPKLEEAIIDQLVERVNFNNLTRFMRTAELFSSEKLKERCYEILNERGDKYLESSAFSKLSMDEIMWTLSYVKVTNMKKFRAIEKWLKVHPDCTKKNEILGKVNLLRLSNRQLNDVVLPTGLYDEDLIFDITESRTEDIAEEFEDFVNVYKGAKVVIGSGSKNIFNAEEFTKAERLDGQWEIVIDLGARCTFNYMEFILDEIDPESMCEILKADRFSTRLRNSYWTPLIVFRNAMTTQNIYMRPTTARFVGIRGVKGCKALKLLRITKPPQKIDSQCCDVSPCPEINSNGNSHATVCLDSYANAFSANNNKVFRLPGKLGEKNCRVLIHGRKQSFRFEFSNLCGQILGSKEFKETDGWHMFTVPVAATTINVKYNERYPNAVNLAHFEVCELNKSNRDEILGVILLVGLGVVSFSVIKKVAQWFNGLKL